MFAAKVRRVVPLMCVVICGACYNTTAPKGWLPTPQASQSAAFGAWVRIDVVEGRVRRRIQGELIALTDQTVGLLTDSGFTSVVVPSIREVSLHSLDLTDNRMGTWMGLGVLSSASHGFAALLSVPVWLIGGGIATSSAVSQGTFRLVTTRSPDAAILARMAKFARFPQGMPPGVDPRALRPKPVPVVYRATGSRR